MKRRAGFTLIELVIVVMILGILAGVAAPKLFNTTATATDNGIMQTLSVVRDAIELYAADHAGAVPANAAALTGALVPTYIRKFPVNPFNGLDDVKAIVTADDATGWMYTGGNFIINKMGSSPTTSDLYTNM
jgi:prepilin-type N-terminal cleavage/methylation domain-containing protein